jgi:Rrf2 family protein
MKISSKGRYGLRAMVDLAAHSTNEHISLNSIAERLEVSENYLEQVFLSLRKAGLVKSVKGAQGGYILSRLPDRITVGDILRALEGSLSIIDEVPEDGRTADTVESCLTDKVWTRIDECINSVVDSITLEDLVTEYIKLNNGHNYMYYI